MLDDRARPFACAAADGREPVAIDLNAAVESKVFHQPGLARGDVLGEPAGTLVGTAAERGKPVAIELDAGASRKRHFGEAGLAADETGVERVQDGAGGFVQAAAVARVRPGGAGQQCEDDERKQP